MKISFFIHLRNNVHFNKIIFFLSFNFIFLTFHFLPLHSAAPHISGRYIEGQPKVKLKVNSYALNLRRRGAPAKEVAKALNVVGTKKVAVIIVDFPDQNFSPGWHDQANNTFSELKKYYEEVSYGKLKLEIKFFYDGGISTGTLTASANAYRLSNYMSYYGQDTNVTLSNLIKDSINKTSGAVVKGSGINQFDYVMVLHAGYGNESTTNPNDIWSAYIDWTGAVGGFTDGTIVPEKEQDGSPVGVTCHEFGHQLGLPDLYYQDGVNQYSRIGKWCLMDYGTWLGTPQGSSPAHLSAWCKYYLGWADVVIISSTVKDYNLAYSKSASTGFVKIPVIVANDSNKEYFLLEYRRKVSYDTFLPGEGILIWRIDDTIASDPIRLANNDINSGDPHYGVDLVEADKVETYNTTYFGDSGDPFPGSSNVTNFFVSDYGIKAYNGESFPLFITNISLNSSYANFNILYEFELQNVSQGQVLIGNNYTYAGKLMLIGFNLLKPDYMEINVYDIAGNLVKSFEKQYYSEGKNQIMWYGTDNSGVKLSPGLYFMSFKTDDSVKVEKFIIKR